MRKILFIFSLSIILFSCSDENIVDVHKTLIIDSVEYHGIGCDNTLQTTPYWKVWFNNKKNCATTHRPYQVNDSIELIIRIKK